MSKYNVGDKVVVKKDLKLNTDYDDQTFVYGMDRLKGKVCTISKVTYDDDGSYDEYELEEDTGNYSWSNSMLRKPLKRELEKQIEDVNSESIDTEAIVKELKKISENMNKRTLYDEIVIDKIKEKAKEISLSDLVHSVCDNVDKYVQKTYGIIPKVIQVNNGVNTKQLTGLFHNKFEDILKIVNKGVPVMLTGPAGAGKNHTLEQVAEALCLDFYFSNAITQEFKLTGFIDANGVYQETQFYKAFKNGGLFFLDEIDASCPDSLIILNSAIANGYFDFPNGRVNAHENFRVVCAGNTYGTGADMVYVGRNVLDGATLDRFAVIDFDYDEEVERQLAYDDELYHFVSALRKAIKDSSLRYIVSMRATINSTKLLEIGMTKKEVLKSVIIKNMQIDDINTIYDKINDNSEWTKLLGEFKNVSV